MKVTNMFQNLKIGTKIASGFVIMIILLIFVAYIGYNGIRNVENRVIKADDTNRLVKLALETRRAEKNYILREDEKHISEVNDGVQGMLDQAKTSKDKFDQLINKNQMDTVTNAVKNYQRSFNTYVNSVNKKVEKMEEMRTQAKVVMNEIESLRQDQKKQLTSDQQAGLSITRIQERVKKADDASRIRWWFLETRKHEKEYIISGKQQWFDNHKKRMGEIIELANNLESRFRKQLHINQINTVISALNNYQTDFDDFIGIQRQQNQIETNMLNAARKVIDTSEDARADQKVKMEKTIIRAETLMLIFILVTIVLSLIIAFIITNSISKPVKNISEVAVKISEGDLSIDLPESERSDEVGILSKAFRSMVKNLRNQIKDIMEAVNVLTTTVSEISSTTSQLSSSSQETATAVSETSTTIEEVKQTAELASKKAKDISENAKRTIDVAKNDKKAVEGTSRGIERISNQMNLIASSIMKLSEQSQAIGEITGSINDLAEQSNLLAVNASIEAVKAGEEGKGFSVVAQEIRSLAEQSKQATKQVKEIIADIQKATSAAVMATEEGSKAVEAGQKQPIKAGNAIETLADAIDEAAQATIQIGTSAQQQFIGIEQVNEAAKNISTASTQNLESTKQLETAAHNLNELGQNLKKLVEMYKV